MGSDAVKGYGAKGRFDGLWFAPEDLTLVNNVDHELFDERTELKLDEALVRNIMARGVIEPVVIVRQGTDAATGKPLVLVVDGRQRVKAALEANTRLVAEGKEAVRVPAVVSRDQDLLGVMIAANELRRGDSPMAKARKLGRYLTMGRTDEQAALAFGVTGESIRQWKILLELHPEVQKAVDRRELPAAHAQKLRVLPFDEQPAALAKMREAGDLRGQAGEEAARGLAGKPKAGATRLSLRVSPTEVRVLRRTLEPHLDRMPAKARAAVEEVLERLRALEKKARGAPGRKS